MAHRADVHRLQEISRSLRTGGRTEGEGEQDMPGTYGTNKATVEQETEQETEREGRERHVRRVRIIMDTTALPALCHL